MNRFLAFICISLIGFNTSAQPWFPIDGNLFRTDVIPRVDISIHPDTLNWIYDNVDSDLEFKANFTFTANGKTDTVNEVGFRLRGNTSRNSAKKSFKISFNTFVSGQKYGGVEKLNLNGEHNDPSIIRSFLTWHFFEQMLIPSSRCNYVNVYVNNSYYGLYMNVEHVDEEFIDNRFGHNSGNLYKCLFGANLTYISENKNDYKNRGYTLQNNTETDDFSDLIQFIKTLNNSTQANLPNNLEPIFNVNGFLRYLAVETFTGHWDGYSFNMNNYYLYHNQITNKFEFMPYDADNTFGIDWFGIDWGTRNIYEWYNDGNQVPLTKKTMANPVYKDRYSYFLNELLKNYSDTVQLFDSIDAVREKIAPWANLDPYRPLDYGWSFNDFLSSYTKTLGAHVKYGVKPYIKKRYDSIKSQLQLNPISPIVENVYHNFPLQGQDLEIKANITDDQPNANATLFTSINGGAFTETLFTKKQGTLYTALVSGITGSATVNYYIEATDVSNQKTREPYFGNYSISIGESNTTLIINEFMASNSASVYDNYGQTEDWIELYNNGANPVFLGDKYLTDDLTDRTKWKLPNITLEANQYIVIWADGNTNQGDNHANFKLAKGGESIGIFDGLALNYSAIDTLSYSAQTDDVSVGRNLDGNISPQNAITPGGENESPEMAYINFSYNMSAQIMQGYFNAETDYIDIAGTFNNWNSTDKFVDNNLDGIIRFTLFGFSKNQNIEYKARVNGSWDFSEFKEQGGAGNRKYTTESQLNSLKHWFNDVENDILVQELERPVKIFPMPVQSGNPLTLVGITELTSVQVYNTAGQMVAQHNSGSKHFTISPDLLSKGVYVLVVRLQNNQTFSEKVVVY